MNGVARGYTAAEKPELSGKIRGVHPSGAKAQYCFVAFTARLKSCPFKTMGSSAACLFRATENLFLNSQWNLLSNSHGLGSPGNGEGAAEVVLGAACAGAGSVAGSGASAD